MTRADPTGPLLRGYLGLTALAGPLGERHLRRRLARGKEDPARWREKLGVTSASRPAGRLIWCHAVGLGEVLALRGLIEAMAGRAPEASFLVTSSARASGEVFAKAPPPRTLHQFLPLDLPGPVARFLDHWQPDLSIWAEQDLWPRLVVETARRGVPLALVNARMGARAFGGRARARGLYRDLYARFALIEAQDAGTAGHLTALGATGVRVGAPLKAAAPPLPCDAGELARLRGLLAGRRVWLAAASHPGDEAVALAAHRQVLAADPAALLILAPRDPRRDLATDLPMTRRSAGQGPDAAVWVADTFGEMGLWYRLAPAALIGGGFGIGGHNPWEAAALGCAILHGPGVGNFAGDYARLQAAGGAMAVADGPALAAALDDPGLPAMAQRAHAEWQGAQDTLAPLADTLLGLIR